MRRATRGGAPPFPCELAQEDTVDPTEEEIRELAYRLWEEDGCPEGQALEHWARARRMLRNGARKRADEPGASVDEQIEDSFPASDPPSYNAGGKLGAPRGNKSSKS